MCGVWVAVGISKRIMLQNVSQLFLIIDVFENQMDIKAHG